MTPAELKAKLDELLKLPAETEWVEFKEAKTNFDSDDLGKYFVALCNEANLTLPEYDFSQPDTVRMEIMGRLIDENYSRVLIEKADLDLGTVVALDKVQKRKPITPEELKHLRWLKLVEGRAPNVFVASKIAAITGDKAQYIRNRAFDTAHYKKMILDFIHEFGSATRKDIDDLLKGKLSDVLTPHQQAVRIKNLLAIMAQRDKSITNSGPKKLPRWVARNKDTDLKKHPENP